MRNYLKFVAILAVAFLCVGISSSVFAACVNYNSVGAQPGKIISNGTTYTDYCSTDKKNVIDYYCIGGIGRLLPKPCGNGSICDNGICKASVIIPPVNCANLAGKVTSSINMYGTVSCGNVNYKSINDVNGDKSVNASDVLATNSMTDAQCIAQLNNINDVCSSGLKVATAQCLVKDIYSQIVPGSFNQYNILVKAQDLPVSAETNYEVSGTEAWNSYGFEKFETQDNITTLKSTRGLSNSQVSSVISTKNTVTLLDSKLNVICKSISSSQSLDSFNKTIKTTETFNPPVNCANLASRVTSSINMYGTVSCGNANYKGVNDVNGDKSVNASDVLATHSMTDAQCVSQLNNPKDVCSSACAPNWQVGSWSVCTNSQQTRVVTDLNKCGVTTSKPAETQNCSTTSSCSENPPLGDGGKNYEQNGTMLYNNRSYTDYCYNTTNPRQKNYLLEFFCDASGIGKSEWHDCTENGAKPNNVCDKTTGRCKTAGVSALDSTDTIASENSSILDAMQSQIASLADAITKLLAQFKK